nr:hypothetical protein [Saprospiraceae bacterium]
MRKSSTLLFTLLAIATFYAPKVFSQCNLTANAGPDQVICAPGGLVNLNGSGSGGFSNILWTPSESITDPSSLSTSAEVTQTTTFTLTLSGSGATSNLIVGGNFTGGGAFTSDYIPGTGGSFGILSNEGEYAVGPNSGAFHSNWASCTDHTGGGDMLVVNGATTDNENVWCQTVSVSPNTQYEFGTWIASVLSSNPAELQFSINGTLLGSTFNAPSSPCVWSQFFETWNSGSATSAQICIVNQNTEGSGNDFAIDDITFGPVCADTDEMTVTVVDVDAMADPSAVLPCNFGNGINLSGLGSSTGAGVSYLWETPDGNIVSGANTLSPVVSAAGNYLLTVTLTVGNTICTETALVEVTPDTDIPVAEIAQPNAISCTEPDAILDGTISSIGSNFTYLWTASNGGTISGPNNNPIAAGTTPGNYTLLVTNTLNGCTAEATTTVTANFGFPSANAQASGSLNCNNTLVTLNGNNSTPGNLEYFWSTNNGSITSSPDLPTVTVDEPGTYVLTVTNPTNGCSDTEQITVSANTTPPTAIIATPGSINCTATNLNLNASGSTGTGNLSFNWTTSGGNIVSGGQTASPNVNAPGSYTVTVTQSSNGCSATATVQVAGDNSLPTISIAPPNPLTCATNQIGLSATTTGSGLTYAWTTASGTIVAGANSLTPTVGATGTYTLTVTQPNGCTAVSSVQVTNNLTPPAAEAGTAPLLNCQSATANLNGNGSASGNGISYQWTTANGTISTGATTLSPTVTSAGTYYLTVLDAGNGCSAMDSVVVQQNSSLPTVSIAPVASLNCNAETININAASSSSGSGFTFSWATVGGSFAVGQNTLTPTVNGPGIYTLTITNTASQCSSTASVTVTSNFNTPVAAAAQPTLLTCDLTSQMLDATASTFGTNSQINWTATQGGNILAGATTLTPQINEPGLYTLIINDLDSGCADTTQVTVAENVALPTALAGPTDVLTCTVASVSLNGSGSSAGTGFQYLWTTTDGNIFSGANSLTPTVDAPGTYLLTVENTANGCSATSSVTITQNGNFPSVNAGTSQPLTCTLTQTYLNANADQGSQFSYLWTSADGAILQGETTLSPLVGAPGTYVLTVTNAQNGCSATSSVTLGENVVPPLADAGNPGTLSCTQSELSLNGSGSAPNGSVSLIWTTFNGNIVTGQTTTSPQINAPGTYQLTVTNTANGCTATDQVTIAQDASLPTANAGTADDLTCLLSSVQLDGSASSTGLGFSFEWTTTDGQFQSGQSTLTPTVNAPGTYLLTIANT